MVQEVKSEKDEREMLGSVTFSWTVKANHRGARKCQSVEWCKKWSQSRFAKLYFRGPANMSLWHEYGGVQQIFVETLKRNMCIS